MNDNWYFFPIITQYNTLNNNANSRQKNRNIATGISDMFIARYLVIIVPDMFITSPIIVTITISNSKPHNLSVFFSRNQYYKRLQRPDKHSWR